MKKPTNPNINFPQAFAIDGQKTDFLEEKIQDGFDPIDPDVLAGDNLNKFIDDTYKGLHYAMDGVNDLYKGAVLYSSTETYNSTSIVFSISEDGIALYHSLTDNNLGNPLTDETKWQKVNLGSAGTSLPTHSLVFSDRVLSFAESKGLAPLGSYVYKDAVSGSRYGYPTFYNNCVEEMTAAENESVAVAVNVHNTGCVIDSNFIVSGFSTRNFIQPTSGFYPSYDSSQPWEVVEKTTTGTLGANQSFIGGCDSFDYYGVVLQLINNKLRLGATNNGTSWNLINLVSGTKVFESNTTYWFKLEYTGTQYIASWSTDGQNYTPDITVAQSAGAALRSFCLGNTLYSASAQEPWLGTIDLKECYIKINNELVWLGTQNLIKNTNGHIYYDIAQKPTADYLYNTYGACWAYGVDTENERIFLPRNDWFFQSGNADNVGKFNEAGLPNITGTAKAMGYAGRNDSGALYTTGTSNEAFAGGADGRAAEIINLDASRSNAIYGKSNTVQPPSVNQIVYMVVGNTEVESAITDVTDVTTTENDTIPLFTGMYFDFTPNHVSWLKAGEQANNGGLYASAYNTLVNELTTPTYGLKVIDTTAMQSNVDYSEYWKVDQDAMTFTTPTRTAQRVLVAKKEATAQDPTWFNWYSDGWLEQGGSIEATTSGSVLLIKPFSSVNYSAFATVEGAAQSYTCSVVINSTSEITVQSGTASSSTKLWQTSGYGAIPSLSDYTEDIKLYFKVNNAVENKDLIDLGEITEALADKIGTTECKAYVTETYSNGTSWYRVWSDGWIEQGGYWVGNPQNYTVEISLLKPYKTWEYHVSLSGHEDGVPNNFTMNRGSNHSQLLPEKFFVIVSFTGSNLGFSWTTSGY